MTFPELDTCNLFDDLVPLYIDDVCSDDGRKIVEKHMQQCSDCKAKHDVMTSELLLDQEAIEHNLKAHDALTRLQQRQMVRDLFGQCVAGAVFAPLLGYAIGATDLGYWCIGGFVFNLASYLLAWLVSLLSTGTKGDGVRDRVRLVSWASGLIAVIGGYATILFAGAFGSSRWKSLVVFSVMLSVIAIGWGMVCFWIRKRSNGACAANKD